MFKKILILFAVTVLTISIQAEDKFTYSRKSISGPNQTWLSTNAKKVLPPSCNIYLQTTLQKKIELRRFDYNTLPDYVFSSVSENLSTNTDLNEENLLKLFSQFAMPEIINILNNAEIQKSRIEQNQSDAPKINFADTKGNAQNIQIADLEKFFNSAYIYFPYVTKVTVEESELRAKSTITGGIIWYNIKDDGYGNKTLVHIKTIETVGTSTVYKDLPKDMKGSLAGELISVVAQNMAKQKSDKNVKERVIKNAIEDWADQLSIGTKKIEQFQLGGQIIETKGWNYTLNIGNSEGVELDSAYEIMDIQEENGTEILKPIGFGMITKTQNKKKQSLNHVQLSQQLGKKQTVGGYVKEYPRLWTHLQISAGKRDQMKILSSEVPGLKKDITEGTILALGIMKNLAPMTGLSQLFIGAQLDATFVSSELNDNLSGTPLLYSAGLVVEKKFWYKSNALAFNIGYGFERFQLSTSGDTKYDISLDATHLNIGAKYEKLLTKNLSAFCAFEQRLSTKPLDNSIKENGIDKTDDYEFNDTRFGGSSIKIGLNYIIPATYKIR